MIYVEKYIYIWEFARIKSKLYITLFFSALNNELSRLPELSRLSSGKNHDVCILATNIYLP